MNMQIMQQNIIT